MAQDAEAMTQSAESVAPPKRETRARRRIRQAVESRGYKLVSLEWEPWSNGGEKSGICGGWYGTLDRPTSPNIWPGNEIMGLSVDETVAWVDTFVPPPEPCDCLPLYPLTAQVPTFAHGPECQWHLDYRLHWWPEHIDGRDDADRA